MQDRSKQMLLDPVTSFRHTDKETYRNRRNSRLHLSRKTCFFVFLSCCLVTVVYLVLARPGSSFNTFSIFKVTQNVYVEREDNFSTGELEKIRDDHYCVVFDAGSTGTRIHIFHFEKSRDGNLKLIKDIFKKVKPGLSSYADNPNKAVESVKSLLAIAKDYIPKQKWYQTPLVLRATAGLRLIPSKKADEILDGIKRLFVGNIFQKIGDDFVSIMDGDSEGIYGWLTVNYLTEKLKPLEISKMYGALDLGGGSVQITLPLNDKEIEENQIPSNFIKSIDISLNSYTLYTHSYLGLGLMSARAAILNASAVHQEDSKKVISVSSSCFPSSYKDVWKFAGHTFEIRGTDQCSFENCQDFAKSVVAAKGINHAANANSANIFAFSYFFDRATELSLIDESSGGEIMVQNYVDAAQTVCQRGSVAEKPFLCLDTTYISTLLTDGFGLGLHQKLLLKRNINEFDVSWAVGAALDLYEQARKISHS